MTVLTADDIAGRHSYLADARPNWQRSMAGITNDGGPWQCNAGHASFLSYRCSVCGKDLADQGDA